MKAAIYCRVSTEGQEQDGTSLQTQLEACQDWAIKDNHKEYDEDDSLLKDPFSCLYAPENLYQLAKRFDLQSGIEVWEPSKNKANEANSIIIHMGKRMLEFVDWIDEIIKT